MKKLFLVLIATVLMGATFAQNSFSSLDGNSKKIIADGGTRLTGNVAILCQDGYNFAGTYALLVIEAGGVVRTSNVALNENGEGSACIYLNGHIDNTDYRITVIYGGHAHVNTGNLTLTPSPEGWDYYTWGTVIGAVL